MGFTVYYRSTRRLSPGQASRIRKAADALNEGRTWLSCEPVNFFKKEKDGKLFGGSKPTFMPHPDDAAAAVQRGLPDGTTRNLIDILCKLSKDYGVDWEISHDYEDCVGFIRAGECEPHVLDVVEGLADLGGTLSQIIEESYPPSHRRANHDDDRDDDGEPSILPFRPKGD